MMAYGLVDECEYYFFGESCQLTSREGTELIIMKDVDWFELVHATPVLCVRARVHAFLEEPQPRARGLISHVSIGDG